MSAHNSTITIADDISSRYSDGADQQTLITGNMSPSQSRALGVRCKAPATCGELMQAVINGQDFLINCPINLYSHAHMQRSFEAGVKLSEPDSCDNVAKALDILKKQLGAKRYTLNLNSEVPHAKGMASSSAELTAAVGALMQACDFSMDNAELSKLLTKIAPSSHAHIPGIAHVNHLTGELHESLTAPAALSVLVVDCGGEVDTLEYDRDVARSVYEEHQDTVICALGQLLLGLRTSDELAVAQAATRSAILSQKILFKPQFGKLLQHSVASGALGVNCAHQGTVLGILYRNGSEQLTELKKMIDRRFGSSLNIIGNHQIVGGGFRDY